MKVTHQYKSFENHNLIIDLLNHDKLSVNDIKSFMPLSKQHKKEKKGRTKLERKQKRLRLLLSHFANRAS